MPISKLVITAHASNEQTRGLMAIDLSKIILIDNHAHSILKGHMQIDALAFRGAFTETRSAEMLEHHVPSSLHFIELINRLGKVLGIKGEGRILDFRAELTQHEYIQRLWDAASIGALIVDDGYKPEEMLSLRKLSELSGRPIFRACRIEHMLEQSIEEANSFTELRNAFHKLLVAAGSVKTVALKTIAAYRGGLALDVVSADQAKNDFDRAKSEVMRSITKTGKARIYRGPLYHYFLLESFEVAAAFGLPVQVHSGIGDDDADLLDANPLLLRDVFSSRRFGKTQFVLLHCFPYVNESAYLASLYPTVYFDLSLAVSLVSSQAHRLFTEALSVAPFTKLLGGTDGHSVPESHWFAAFSMRRGLERALGDLVKYGSIDEEEAMRIAARILHANARSLYKLDGLA